MIGEGSPRGLAGEVPVDLDLVAVDFARPGGGFLAKSLPVGNSSLAETLSCIEADLDFGLIQPTGVFWRVAP